MLHNLAFDTSNEQEEGLTYVVKIENVRRSELKPPELPLSNDEYLLFILDSAVSDYTRQEKVGFQSKVTEALKVATPEKQAEVAVLLGISK